MFVIKAHESSHVPEGIYAKTHFYKRIHVYVQMPLL
jgi:hypothetical protein